ncbi:MAG: FAD-dependent oxidoreductase [Acidobacteriota bacterium]
MSDVSRRAERRRNLQAVADLGDERPGGRPAYERWDEMQPILSAEALDRVAAAGQIRRVELGELLIEPGDQQTHFVAVRSGRLAIEIDICDATDLIVEHGRGGFAGEIDMFSNRRALARCVCVEAGEMIFLDRDTFRRMLAAHSDLSDIITRAFILRRLGLIESQRGDLLLLGDDDMPDVVALRSFLSRNGHPYRSVDLFDRAASKEGAESRERPASRGGTASEEGRESAEARKILDHFNLSRDDLPVAIHRNTDALVRPTARALADRLGLSRPTGALDVHDVVVVGVGPAGLAAAVNAAAEGLSVLAIESTAPGGQAGTSSKIENYPGFPIGLSGLQLGSRMLLQAQRFGAEVVTPRRVVELDVEAWPRRLTLDDGETFSARSVVISTGATWRRLGLDRERELENVGVFYGATAVEATLCVGREVVIVGGGNSAGQAAVFLARRARHVHVVVRGDGLAASMSDYLVRRIEGAANISLHTRAEIIALEGERRLESIVWRRDGRDERRDLGHLFVMIGAAPNTGWLAGGLLTDAAGFLLTGADLPTEHLVSAAWAVDRLPFLCETSRPGVFAVGDVRSGSVKRVASAVGEGAMAAQFLYKVVHA